MNKMLHTVIISVGSNTHDSNERVGEALHWLDNILEDNHSSGIYSTHPFSGYGADYTNAVVIGSTNIEANTLEVSFKEYELLQGRDEQARNKGIVTIDLDLVYYDDECLRPKDVSRNFFIEGINRITMSHPELVGEKILLKD